MNRYDFLIYESRQGEISVEAESPKEARAKAMEIYKAGGVQFKYTMSVDDEILDITPLKNIPLQRFEIWLEAPLQLRQGGAVHRSSRGSGGSVAGHRQAVSL